MQTRKESQKRNEKQKKTKHIPFRFNLLNSAQQIKLKNNEKK